MKSVAPTQIIQSAIAALCLVGTGYNGLLLLNSDEGVRMKSYLDQEIEVMENELAELTDRKKFLHDRADRLMSASLDEDLLEERVRSVLGLVRPDEKMVRMQDLDRMSALANDAAQPKDNLASARLAFADLSGPVSR